MRSFTHRFLRLSQDTGIWAAKPETADKLVDAYLSSQNVYLAFSVNSSRAYQGYVRSPPSQDLPLSLPNS
jgi:YT521-B-like domain